MTTIENLEKQLADALTRERQLREALEFISTQLQSDSDNDLDAHTVARTVIQALSTPAPRVFTVEDVKPLMEALDRGFNLIAHANPHAFDNGVKDGSGTIDEGDVVSGHIYEEMRNALAHARKLGMEGA